MDRKRATVYIVSATEAKNRFGALIKRAYMQQEHLIVERDGIPVVAIVPLSDYEALVSSQELPPEAARAVAAGTGQQLARRRLQDFLAQVHARLPEVAEEEVERDVQEALEAVRGTR